MARSGASCAFTLRMAVVVHSLAALSQVQARQDARECGDGPGNRLGLPEEVARCRACNGADAQLVFCGTCANNLGHTWCTAAGHPSPANVAGCGEGVGDVTRAPGGAEACRACGGEGAALSFCEECNDGAGYTSCESDADAGRPAAAAPTEQLTCGEGFGNRRADSNALEVCLACKGRGAFLEYCEGCADGLGYTFCKSQSVQTPSAREAGGDAGGLGHAVGCGEGVGDLRGTVNLEACRGCRGNGAYLDFCEGCNDGTGFTSCKSHGDAVQPTDAPPAREPPCGEGFSDRSADSNAQEACITCKGKGAFLQYCEACADGLGYTFCKFPGGGTPFPKTVAGSSPAAACGEGVGDLRGAAGLEACQSCKGAGAVLDFCAACNDGVGHTSCKSNGDAAKPTVAPPTEQQACGEGFSNRTADSKAQQACIACKGEGAILEYCAGCADGLGYSSCKPPRVGAPSPGVAEGAGAAAACGEGVGDVRGILGRPEACRACGGEGAVLDFCESCNDGAGYTSCKSGTRPVQPTDAPPAEQPTCGEGFSDRSADSTAQEACAACRGKDAILSYCEGCADGLGYTFCKGPRMVAGPPADAAGGPALPGACGEGAGDMRGASALEACRACRGEGAALDFCEACNDGIGYTSCKSNADAARPADAPLAQQPACGEGFSDRSAQPGAQEACVKCRGMGAFLEYCSGCADGLGYTSCKSPRAGMSSTRAAAGTCGEGPGDLRGAAGSREACTACHGQKALLQYCDQWHDVAGYTFCQSPKSAGLGDHVCAKHRHLATADIIV